jgi:hypothetical protein
MFGSRNGDYERWCLLGWDVVWKVPTYILRGLLTPFVTIRYSETSVDFQQTILRYIPQNRNVIISVVLVDSDDGVYKNDWGFGLCPSSGILKSRKHDVSETESVSVFR